MKTRPDHVRCQPREVRPASDGTGILTDESVCGATAVRLHDHVYILSGGAGTRGSLDSGSWRSFPLTASRAVVNPLILPVVHCACECSFMQSVFLSQIYRGHLASLGCERQRGLRNSVKSVIRCCLEGPACGSLVRCRKSGSARHSTDRCPCVARTRWA